MRSWKELEPGTGQADISIGRRNVEPFCRMGHQVLADDGTWGAGKRKSRVAHVLAWGAGRMELPLTKMGKTAGRVGLEGRGNQDIGFRDFHSLFPS